MADLSILMPARNEMFLARTIADVLANMRGDTEIIAVCDGAWADPPVPDHPRVQLVYRPEPIGQRAATNLAARLSRAPYVMKLDAHCSVDEGFDIKLMAADREIGRPDLTQIPAQYNLHAFNWQCNGCGRQTYQGPTPTECAACGAAKGFERVIVWERRQRVPRTNGEEPRGGFTRTEFWRFDSDLHFQYWNGYKDRPEASGEIVDVMSSVGACFFMRRDRFLEIGGLDEAHGSWGQFGTEIACKSWLSGGRHVVNKRTWFAHLFRTQGRDFSFPYPQPQSAVEHARAHSRKLWIDGTWPQARYSLAWLVEKFAPVPGWSHEAVTALRSPRGPHVVSSRRATKGLAYYSDCRPDPRLLAAVREQIVRANPGGPIVSVTLQPVDFGQNLVGYRCTTCGRVRFLQQPPPFCIDGCANGLAGPPTFDAVERGYLTMFRQQLAALEALDTDYVFMVEHDVLYHPSHFDFTPPTRDVFYYNRNTWKVDAKSGQALHYLCDQVSGLCADRELLVEHYRRRVAQVEAHGFDRSLGYEPGTNRRSRALHPHGSESWMSAWPNVDIRSGHNLTRSRWRQDQFRNPETCLGWMMADAVPGWGVTKGRFDEFLVEVGAKERAA